MTNENQATLPWGRNKNIKKENRDPIYIPRSIAEQIWATSIHKTEIRYTKENVCNECNEVLSTDHVKRCASFADIQYPENFIQKLRTKNIREWDKQEIREGLDAYEKI